MRRIVPTLSMVLGLGVVIAGLLTSSALVLLGAGLALMGASRSQPEHIGNPRRVYFYFAVSLVLGAMFKAVDAILR